MSLKFIRCNSIIKGAVYQNSNFILKGEIRND